MATAVSLGDHSLEPDFNQATPSSLSSHGGRWNVFGSDVPTEEIVFFTPVILIYVIAITSIVNLTMDAKNDTLWRSLLSASLGYMLPAPQLNNHKKKQI